ncbi:SpoIIE family protein phosphatase [Streptomyces cavernae]|uniref:SpoIIE family protein phosphatase n=1 Tax=Streptomyces cavernae TaxID=2259034 RepID=UPI001EE4C9D0|nr:SpoIIE family protein phosphatase [Streptomyces cavernae]
MPRVWEVPVHDSTRVRDVRVAAEEAAGHAGLDGDRTAAAALVATELATNLLKHGGGGHVLLDMVRTVPETVFPEAVPPETGAVLPETEAVPPETVDSPTAADRSDGPRGRSPGSWADESGERPESPAEVQIVAIDHGPGMADVEAALRDGYSTTGSLGAGLGTCRRVSDAFDVHSAPGRGTVTMARIGARRDRRAARPTLPPVRAGGVNVPFAGAEYSGDAWAWARAGDRVTLMLADGLGHGPEAARASTAAVRELRRSAHLAPVELLRRLDTALRTTRGAAVAVAQADLGAGRLDFAGLGNIGARLRRGDTWQPLLSHPGIVGAHRPRTLHRHRTEWDADCLLIMHSDGLPSRWSPGPAAGRTTLDPAVLAAVILRDASSSARPVRDDTTVAVLSPTPPDRTS